MNSEYAQYGTGAGRHSTPGIIYARDVNRQATKGFSEKEIRQLRDYINRMKQNLEGE